METPVAKAKKWSAVRTAKAILALLAAVLLLDFVGGIAVWSVGSICPKCLQLKDTVEIRVLGIPVFWKNALLKGQPCLMSSLAFSPGVPPIDPAIYEEILGLKCRHAFRRDSFGRTKQFLWGAPHADGIGGTFVPRVEATAGLYFAYTRTRDKTTAQAVYEMIHTAYPVDGRSRDVWLSIRQYVWRGEALKIIHLLDECRPEDGKIARQVLELRRLAEELSKVETPSDFAEVCREFASQIGLQADPKAVRGEAKPADALRRDGKG